MVARLAILLGLLLAPGLAAAEHAEGDWLAWRTELDGRQVCIAHAPPYDSPATVEVVYDPLDRSHPQGRVVFRWLAGPPPFSPASDALFFVDGRRFPVRIEGATMHHPGDQARLLKRMIHGYQFNVMVEGDVTFFPINLSGFTAAMRWLAGHCGLPGGGLLD